MDSSGVKTLASEEVASENKLKDKKVTDIFHKEALSVFLCASPTMHSGFFRGSPLHMEVGHHGKRTLSSLAAASAAMVVTGPEPPGL